MPTTSLGIVTPAGTDRVAVAIDLQTMANGTNQAILDMAASSTGAPVYTAGADLNDKTTDGTVTVLGSDTHANRPFGWTQTAIMRTYYVTSTAGLQVWAEVGGLSRTASRYRGSTGWQPWVRTDTGDRVTFSTLTSGAADQTLPVGMYAIPDPSVVTGLPSAAVVPGALEVAPQLLTFSESALPGATWEKRFVGGLWQQWMRVRRQVSVPWALTRPQAATTETQVSRSVRLPFTIPAPVRQWRVVIRNANYRTNTVYSGGTTLSSVYVGPGARDGSDVITSSFGAATTDFPSGQKALVANATVTDLGAGWTSGWQQNPLRTGRDYLLSYGYTMDASPTVHLGTGGGWWTNGNPGNAGLTNDATAAPIIRAPFDVRLEMILDDDTPVDIIIGDSINAGSNTTLPVHDAPARQGLTGSRRVPVLHAFGGAALGEWVGVNWGDASTIKWQDVTAYGHADRALIALGSNDINNGTDLTTLQANFLALVALVRARVSTNIIACTVTPRTAWTGTANETLRQAFNAWLRSLPDGIAGCLETAAAVEDSSGTAPRPEIVVSDGIHFTTAGSGMLGQAIAYGGGSSSRTKGDTGATGAPGGSDSATASWITSGPLTQAAGDGRWVKGSDFNTLGDARYSQKGGAGLLNVKESFGALGNDSDDTTALANADAAAQAGYTRGLYFPNGTYRFSGTLTAKTIVGENRQKTVLKYTGTGSALGPVSGAIMYDRRLTNLTILGPGAATTGTIGVDMDRHTSSHFENVSVSDFDVCYHLRDTATLQIPLYNTFINATAKNGGSAGWRLSVAGANENHFIGCRVQTVTGIGLDIQVGGHNVFTSGSIEGCGTGVKITSSTDPSQTRANVVSFTRFENDTVNFDVASAVERTGRILNREVTGSNSDLGILGININQNDTSITAATFTGAPGAGFADIFAGPSFGVTYQGSVKTPAVYNTASFNNARMQLPTSGVVVDRNVADANPTLRVNNVNASNTGNIVEWQAAGAVKARVMNGGAIATRATVVPADTAIFAGEMVLWFDSTGGAAKLMVKAKQADGTVRTGSIPLA